MARAGRPRRPRLLIRLPSRVALPSIAHTLARLSALEMVDALGLGGASPSIRTALAAPLARVSRGLGRVLAGFDEDIACHGLPAAAARTIERLGADLRVEGAVPPRGPVVIVSNHPGAYDALALMAAIGRTDLLVLAASRGFLQALPNLSGGHLASLGDGPQARARGLRRVLAHLRRGGAALQFGAGAIEPDPAFAFVQGDALLGRWSRGTAVLVRAAARVDGEAVLAGVSGVHSARAKGAWINVIAERRGVTMVAPLLQVVLARYRRVHVRVVLSAPRSAQILSRRSADDDALTAAIRAGVAALL